MKEFDYELLARRYAGYFIFLKNTKISTTSLRKLNFIHGNDFKNVFRKCYPIIVQILKEKGFSLYIEKGTRNSVNYICKKPLDNKFSLY